MILGIIAFTVFTGDNASGTAITTTGCGYGKFSVVTALLKRQASLEVAEHRAIARIWKGASFFDQLQSRSRFAGQFLECDLFDPCPWLILTIDS
jgi:hypothetical protein